MVTQTVASFEEHFKEFTRGAKDFVMRGIIDIRNGCAYGFPPYDSGDLEKMNPIDEYFMDFFSSVLVRHYGSELSFRGWPVTVFRPCTYDATSHDVLVYEVGGFRKSDWEEVSLLVFLRKNEEPFQDHRRKVVGWTGPVVHGRRGTNLDLEMYLNAGLIHFCPEEQYSV